MKDISKCNHNVLITSKHKPHHSWCMECGNDPLKIIMYLQHRIRNLEKNNMKKRTAKSMVMQRKYRHRVARDRTKYTRKGRNEKQVTDQ